ncbi:MAG TPA: M91 family zinc metallopeptidase [Cyclobacteriaceae bacterium]|nr:hypothetical protein [Cyclobacteriaceae bacterium]HMX00948.1 M91 family zinc metallopeptidase [Cyclobacteriaceae bacterium]HMX50009.1 M91 family zinc metallopeptidase [Cyclobacteriaceae bacterium]HMY93752.1 M91 family zinc metallopeptidase [Cyclobacteriaceae bacterium]HNA12593.1 M91 family zinc metallopeptidase [Cyclobacteriaceae bacterium]
MNKKLNLLILSAFLIFGNVAAQQPFEDYGYKVKVATLSKGKYQEFFDQDTLVQIGTVVINRLNGKITHFVSYDTTYSEASLQPDLISRWLRPDPLSEKYYSYSPYNFVLNNPIKHIDPDGREVWIVHKKQEIKYDNGKLYNKDGSAYTGKVKGFLKQSVNALNSIGGTTTGGKMLSGLQSSSNVFKIAKGTSSEFKADDAIKANGVAIKNSPAGASYSAARLTGGSGGTLTWNPNKGEEFVSTTKGPESNPTTNLAHEMAHGSDADNGLANNTLHNGLKLDEWQASHTENAIRGEMGLNLRDTYNTKANGPIPLLDATGQPLTFPTLPLITPIR